LFFLGNGKQEYRNTGVPETGLPLFTFFGALPMLKIKGTVWEAYHTVLFSVFFLAWGAFKWLGLGLAFIPTIFVIISLDAVVLLFSITDKG
jgi:hypothetical protein